MSGGSLGDAVTSYRREGLSTSIRHQKLNEKEDYQVHWIMEKTEHFNNIDDALARIKELGLEYEKA